MKTFKRFLKYAGITGEDGDFDWTEVAFVGVIIKFLLASGMDGQSIVGMVTVILAKIHKSRLDAKRGSDAPTNQG